MSTIAIAAAIFVGLFAAAVGAMYCRRRLPDHHLDEPSRQAVTVAMGLVATMSALVLGLLVASAKSAFDSQNGEVRRIAANVSQLDRVLADYGPATAEIRALVRRTVARLTDEVWVYGASRSAVLGDPETDTGAWAIYHQIQQLSPANDLQRDLRALALQINVDLARSRWRLVAEEGSAIPLPFLGILIFWLAILFASFGLFAPGNATVLAALLVGTLSVAGAIFLILELDRPFGGLMQISPEPIRKALERAVAP